MQRPCRVRCRVPESITTPLLLASLTAIARIVLAAVGLCLLAIPAAAQSGPNVVMIILDDMNDWVGALGGHPQTATPRLDALAAEGVLFRNAQAGAPLCNPSRVSLMTGISPARSGIKDNSGTPWRNWLPAAVSLNQAFRNAGYHTVSFGKVYHGAENNQDLSNWNLRRAKPSSAQPPASEIPINNVDIDRGGLGAGDWGIVNAPAAEIDDHKVASWAVEYITGRTPATHNHSFWHWVSGQHIRHGTSRPNTSSVSPAAIRTMSSCRRR